MIHTNISIIEFSVLKVNQKCLLKIIPDKVIQKQKTTMAAVFFAFLNFYLKIR